MNNNICNECGTENEPQYTYCKNCGAQLLQKKTQNPDFQSPSFVPNQPSQGYSSSPEGVGNINPKGFVTDNFQGVSKEEMALFVGKKAYTILPKFTKMELTGNKITWNWPLAILGYFFGPFGCSLWFFYRKMYKHAAILAGIGAVLSLITSFLLIGVNQEVITSTAEALANGNLEAILGLYNQLDTKSIIAILISNLVKNTAKIAAAIIFGLLGYNMYKNHCTNKIISYRSTLSDMRYYQLGLASIGGVSGGMLTLGIIIWYAFSMATEFIISVIKLVL